MNLTFVAPFGLRPKSTVAVRMLPLARGLVSRGHRVTVLIPPWDNPSDSGLEFDDRGVTVVNLRLPGAGSHGGATRLNANAPEPSLDRTGEGAGPPAVDLVTAPALTLRLLNKTTRSRPDVVHVFKPKGFSGAVAQALLLRRWLFGRRLPVVVDTDDWEGPGGWNDRAGYSPWQRALFAYQERWLLEHATAVTAASQTLLTLATALRSPPSEAIGSLDGRDGGPRATTPPGAPLSLPSYLPNGPGAPQDEPDQAEVATLRAGLRLGDAPVLLVYSRFVESPPARMVRIVRSIHDRGVRPVTLLVGTGLNGEHTEFLDLMAAAGLEARHAGWVAPERLPAHFAVAGAAIFPMEDTLLNRAKCSVKLVDLLAAGVPVVAEAVGQCTEYVEHGRSGLLVAPGDVAGFGESAARLLTDRDLRHRIKAGARARIAERFSWPHLAGEVERLYAAVTGPAA